MAITVCPSRNEIAPTLRHPRRRKYTISDWLCLHRLTPQECTRVLQTPVEFDVNARRCSSPTGISGEEAWQLAGRSLGRMLPEHIDWIDLTKSRTTCAFDAGSARPLAFCGPNGPEVRMSYRGTVSDLLTVAHEFGHAVQLIASGGIFIPPVQREICAFVSELALLDALKAHDPSLHYRAVSEWSVNNRNYISQNGNDLIRAVRDLSSPYKYDWNYPVARILASECSAALPRKRWLALFRAEIPLPGLIQFLQCREVSNASCDAACLAIPFTPDEPECPAA